ncbi:phosphatase PAP2 family protein [Actinomycetaceae bacterium WB03_NA08]|uniref:Phosphatase PAP2 family protein n=1 Tax=Scrofimicrobium canadense TaxID=2652290 RepID=A0A6N7W202_9ACTO|nr:phosphatase PAP2 family protein [Scrofimicrobium canadense]
MGCQWSMHGGLRPRNRRREIIGLVLEALPHRRARTARVAAVLVSVALLLVLTWGALYTVAGQNLDNLGMEALKERAALIPEGLDFLTNLVSLPALIVVAAGVAGVALWRRRPALGIRAVIIVAASNLMVQIVKAALSRPELNVSWSLQNSYPSGHTAFAAGVSAALVVVAPKAFRSAAALFGTVWTGLMSLVVVAQGWHRPADTIASILIVAAWTFALAPVEEDRRRANRATHLGLISAWVFFLSAFAVTLLAVLSVRGILPYSQSYPDLVSLVGAPTISGRLFAVSAMFLPWGVQALVMVGVDRLARPGKLGQ